VENVNSGFLIVGYLNVFLSAIRGFHSTGSRRKQDRINTITRTRVKTIFFRRKGEKLASFREDTLQGEGTGAYCQPC